MAHRVVTVKRRTTKIRKKKRAPVGRKRAHRL